MSKSIEQLIMTLNKESDVYSELLDLSKQKRQAIKNSEIEKLSELTDYEQGLVVTLFKLEEIREKVVDMVIRERGLSNIENITELAKYLDGDEREKVYRAKDRLIVLVKNVSDENKFNNRVLEDRLEMINLNINLMTELHDNGQYTDRAVNDEVERKSIFDRRV